MPSLELTETERLMLVGKKEELRKLTEEIIQLTEEIETNKIAIKMKIQGILSLISTLSSYTNSKPNMQPFVQMSIYISHLLESKTPFQGTIRTFLNIFCSSANAMTFSFNKNGLTIVVPKIDLSLFKA